MNVSRREVVGAFAALPLASVPSLAETSARNLELRFDRPAQEWLEALPLGNGRLGAMIFGDPRRTRVALSEVTMWSGSTDEDNDNPLAVGELERVRELFRKGEFDRGSAACGDAFLGRKGNYGTCLPVADLVVDWADKSAPIDGYERTLDLTEGVARVRYGLGNANVSHTAFVSEPDQVMVLRIVSDRPSLSFALLFDVAAGYAAQVVAEDSSLSFAGQARETLHSDGKCGVAFAVGAKLRVAGGRVRTDGDHLIVEDADAVTIVVAINTDYRRIGGPLPSVLCRQQLKRALQRGEIALRRRHVADHRALFDRVEINLGGDKIGQTTDRRLAAVRAGHADPALVALFFQYGRYLTIAGSRASSPLPMNLQGIWNDGRAAQMEWTCDYHLDVNTQQNYWLAEVAALPECHLPLMTFVTDLARAGRRTAMRTWGAKGWVAHTITNAWGYTAPGWGLGWGIHLTGGVWIALHMWEHWLFTKDTNFLREQCYPVLRDAAAFFASHLTDDGQGRLVTGPSISPENVFRTPSGATVAESLGPVCDTIFIKVLFDACLKAQKRLAVDPVFGDHLRALARQLPPLRIATNGTLAEWHHNLPEADPSHRHTTHLVALHPYATITPDKTPTLARAARATLAARMAASSWEDVEWTRANFVNYFARLHDGEAAHEQVIGLLGRNTAPNLLTFSRAGVAGAKENIFCLDGNTGTAAGIAEMLLQTHEDVIHLLPALPRAWPHGKVRGLRAQGRHVVDLEWHDGTLVAARIRAGMPGALTMRLGANRITRQMKLNELIVLTRADFA